MPVSEENYHTHVACMYAFDYTFPLVYCNEVLLSIMRILFHSHKTPFTSDTQKATAFASMSFDLVGWETSSQVFL